MIPESTGESPTPLDEDKRLSGGCLSRLVRSLRLRRLRNAMESAAYWDAQEKAWAVTLKVGHSLYEEEKWVDACGNAAKWKKRVEILSANA